MSGLLQEASYRHFSQQNGLNLKNGQSQPDILRFLNGNQLIQDDIKQQKKQIYHSSSKSMSTSQLLGAHLEPFNCTSIQFFRPLKHKSSITSIRLIPSNNNDNKTNSQLNSSPSVSIFHNPTKTKNHNSTSRSITQHQTTINTEQNSRNDHLNKEIFNRNSRCLTQAQGYFPINLKDKHNKNNNNQDIIIPPFLAKSDKELINGKRQEQLTTEASQNINSPVKNRTKKIPKQLLLQAEDIINQTQQESANGNSTKDSNLAQLFQKSNNIIRNKQDIIFEKPKQIMYNPFTKSNPIKSLFVQSELVTPQKQVQNSILRLKTTSSYHQPLQSPVFQVPSPSLQYFSAQKTSSTATSTPFHYESSKSYVISPENQLSYSNLPLHAQTTKLITEIPSSHQLNQEQRQSQINLSILKPNNFFTSRQSILNHQQQSQRTTSFLSTHCISPLSSKKGSVVFLQPRSPRNSKQSPESISLFSQIISQIIDDILYLKGYFQNNSKLFKVIFNLISLRNENLQIIFIKNKKKHELFETVNSIESNIDASLRKYQIQKKSTLMRLKQQYSQSLVYLSSSELLKEITYFKEQLEKLRMQKMKLNVDEVFKSIEDMQENVEDKIATLNIKGIPVPEEFKKRKYNFMEQQTNYLSERVAKREQKLGGFQLIDREALFLQNEIDSHLDQLQNEIS